jgi:hypothetical protein
MQLKTEQNRNSQNLAEQNSRLQSASDVDAVAAVVKPVLQFVKVVSFLGPPADQLPLGAGRQLRP